MAGGGLIAEILMFGLALWLGLYLIGRLKPRQQGEFGTSD
jgi:hypothetical protein